MGNSCIEAAKTVVDFFPDEPNALFVYDQGPWWCIVHHMMQAVSVLLLGLSYPPSTAEDSMSLIHYVRKVIRWLQIMQDPLAERAYHIVLSSFHTVARRHHVDVSDMWGNNTAQGGLSQQGVNPSVPGYVPAQFVPQHMAMATYGGYDTVSAGAAYPAYADNYYMGR
jgi:hypothetical protein